MVCHGEHTYLFAQAMMSILAQEEQGGSAVRRIGQEVQKSAHERCRFLVFQQELVQFLWLIKGCVETTASADD